jgi:hypothetical protein
MAASRTAVPTAWLAAAPATWMAAARIAAQAICPAASQAASQAVWTVTAQAAAEAAVLAALRAAPGVQLPVRFWVRLSWFLLGQTGTVPLGRLFPLARRVTDSCGEGRCPVLRTRPRPDITILRTSLATLGKRGLYRLGDCPRLPQPEAEQHSVLGIEYGSTHASTVAADVAQSVTASGQPRAASSVLARVLASAASGKAEWASASVRPWVWSGGAACPRTVEGTVGGHAPGRGCWAGLPAWSLS